MPRARGGSRAGQLTGDWTITRIDPTTNKVSATPVQLGQDRPGVAGSTGGLFLLQQTSLVRLDPQTSGFGQQRLVCGQASLAGDASGSIWYFETYPPSGSLAGPGCGELSRFDSSTGAKLQTWPLEQSDGYAGFGVGDGQAWVVQNGTLSRVGGGRRTLTQVKSIPKDVVSVGVGDGVAWWVNPPVSGNEPPSFTRISDTNLALLGTTPLTGPNRLSRASATWAARSPPARAGYG